MPKKALIGLILFAVILSNVFAATSPHASDIPGKRILLKGGGDIGGGVISGTLSAGVCGDTNHVCTYSQGIIASENWIDGNTYVLLTDVNVSGANIVLTIQPGAVVKYLSGTELSAVNSGRIVANGTADKNILFLSCKDQNTYAGSTNANTSTIPGCSGSPSQNDYNTAIWLRPDSGMTASDSLSYLKIFDANNGIVLDDNVGSIHDVNFSHFYGNPSNGIYTRITTAAEIYNNYFGDFSGAAALGIQNLSGADFIGNIHHNTFTNFISTAKGIRNGQTAANIAKFDGNVYSNRFTNFDSGGAILMTGTNSDWNGNIYNNLFANFTGVNGINLTLGKMYGNLYNNTIINNPSGTGFTKISGYYYGNIYNNLFVNVGTPIQTTVTTANRYNNAYLDYTTNLPGPNDVNSATGFTADPFLGDNSDRNFLLNTNANGGALLVDAGFGTVDSFLQLRTTQTNNALDRATTDIGYHYDQNTPYATVTSPSDSNTLTGIQTIDFNIESAFGTASGITVRLGYSTIPSGDGTQIVSQSLSGYSCSSGPYFACAYEWNTITIPDGNYFIVLTAMDSNGSMTDYSNNSFQINNSTGGSQGTASTTICGNNLCQTGETAANCPADCDAVCGDYACTNTENSLNCPIDCNLGCGNGVCEFGETPLTCPVDCKSTKSTLLSQTILKATQQSPTKLSEATQILSSIGYNPTTQLAQALSTIRVNRSFVVETREENGQIVQITKVKLVITNTTQDPITHVELLESLPGAIALTPTNIQTEYPIQTDQGQNTATFSIPGLEPNQTIEIEYTINQPLAENQAKEFIQPLAVSVNKATSGDVQKTKCTKNPDCEDRDLCTANRCINKMCYTIPYNEGDPCDIGSTCQQKVCVRNSQPYLVSGQIDWIPIGTAIFIVLLAVFIGREYFQKNGA